MNKSISTILQWLLPGNNKDNNALRLPQNEQIMKLEAEISRLNLIIAELSAKLKNQYILLEEAVKNTEVLMSETVNSKMIEVYSGLSSPVSQLYYQKMLFEKGTQVNPENIFKLVGAILSTLGETGMKVLHKPGENCTFDPELMNPVKPGLYISLNDPVIIYLPGFRFQNKIIGKSLVDKT
jgi:molecular chaperone GrpE (heat shock protein)